MILEGKTVVVCGAGPGLGREIAVAALRDGANVAVAARTPEKLEKLASEIDSSGERVAAIPTDLTDADQVENLAKSARERFGRVDAVVQVAALDSVFGGAEDGELEDFRRTFETNVIGPVRLTRAFLPHLRDNGGGSVVLVGSQALFQPQTPQVAYGASKGALHTAMYYMAKEFGPDRIRVNMVVPTWMWGPPVEMYVKFTAKQQDRSEEEIVKDITDRMPLGEIPADEDVAESVIFFCSDRARMITGQSLLVNSGELMR